MASADRPGAGGECPWMRMSPGIGLRPTPPPLFRTQGHSPPPSDLRGGRGAKGGNPTLQESGFPASLRSDVPARAAGLRGESPPASAFGESPLPSFAPKACRPRRDPSGRREARNPAPASLDEQRNHPPHQRQRKRAVRGKTVPQLGMLGGGRIRT